MLYRTLFAFLALLLPAATQAQPLETIDENTTRLETRAADVVAVLQSGKAVGEVFSPSFLSAVPPETLARVNAQLVAQFGPVQGLESVTQTGESAATIAIRFEKAIGSGPMQLENVPPYRVTGLLLNDFRPTGDNAEKLTADLAAFSGKVSVFYAPLADGEAHFARDETSQYAIGSTFKLYILSALARSIEAGERKWDDVIAIDRASFPSGQMQDWPEDAPVTLHTLATMMISISDNTATDLLLHEVGRDAVEAELRASGHSDPARALPLLSTLEMFALKGNPGNLREYIEADEAGRRFILADFEDDIRGDPGKVAPPRFEQPTAIDTVEWFASGEDLRKLMRRIVARDDPTAREIMTVSPSMAEPQREKWRYVGYKGGSEPGVLNLTWLLQDKDGEWHVLVMSWNDEAAPVDHTAFELLSTRILSLPRD